MLNRDVEVFNDDFVKSSLLLSFLNVSKGLLESEIDCTYSGSTTVMVLIIGRKL